MASHSHIASSSSDIS